MHWRDLGIVLICVCLGAAAQLCLKRGVGQVPFVGILGVFRTLANPFVFSAFLQYGLAALLYLWVLKGVELSQIYPLISLGYVIVVFLSAVILREPVTFLRWLGVLLIVAGSTFVARS